MVVISIISFEPFNRDSQESGSMEVLNKNSIMRMRNLVEPLDHIEASIITSSMSTAELDLALF